MNRTHLGCDADSLERGRSSRGYMMCHYCCSRWSTPTHTTVCQPTIWTSVTPPLSSSSQCLWEYRRKRNPNWLLIGTHSLVLLSLLGVSNDLCITVDKWVSPRWGALEHVFFYIYFFNILENMHVSIKKYVKQTWTWITVLSLIYLIINMVYLHRLSLILIKWNTCTYIKFYFLVKFKY